MKAVIFYIKGNNTNNYILKKGKRKRIRNMMVEI